MDKCPKCNGPLTQSRTEFGAMFGCAKCGGIMATMAVLRRIVEHKALASMWQAAVQADERGDRPCPTCRQGMVQTPASETHDAPVIDLCPHCQVVWLDATELEQLPLKPSPPPSRDKPADPKAREAMARFHLDHLQANEDWEDAGSNLLTPSVGPKKWISVMLRLLTGLGK